MTLKMDAIGVLGAGQMGRGITISCLLAGHKTFLHDAQSEVLESSLSKIEVSLNRLSEKNLISKEQIKDALIHLTLCPNLDPIKEASILIEAIPEDYSIKENLFRELSDLLTPSVILASNTSSLSITQLAKLTPYPEKFIGLHFMNPAEIMPLVEIIPGEQTHPSIQKTIELFAEGLGKTAVVSKDTPGFIVNRLLIPMINEAIDALSLGIATSVDIDKAMKLGANFPQGPLALADMIGLDTCLAILQVMEKECDNPKYTPSPLLTQYVNEGKLGRKTKEGFYKY